MHITFKKNDVLPILKTLRKMYSSKNKNCALGLLHIVSDGIHLCFRAQNTDIEYEIKLSTVCDPDINFNVDFYKFFKIISSVNNKISLSLVKKGSYVQISTSNETGIFNLESDPSYPFTKCEFLPKFEFKISNYNLIECLTKLKHFTNNDLNYYYQDSLYLFDDNDRLSILSSNLKTCVKFTSKHHNGLVKGLSAIVPKSSIDTINTAEIHGDILIKTCNEEFISFTYLDKSQNLHTITSRLIVANYGAIENPNNKALPIVNFECEKNLILNSLTLAYKTHPNSMEKEVNLKLDSKNLYIEISQDDTIYYSNNISNVANNHINLQLTVDLTYLKQIVDCVDSNIFNLSLAYDVDSGNLVNELIVESNGIVYVLKPSSYLNRDSSNLSQAINNEDDNYDIFQEDNSNDKTTETVSIEIPTANLINNLSNYVINNE